MYLQIKSVKVINKMENDLLKERRERLEYVFNTLVLKKEIKYQKDFAKILGRDKSNVSQALKGNPYYLTEDFLINVSEKVDFVNRDWLIDGVEVQKHHNPPYNEAISDEETPLFSVDAAANLKTLFDNKNQNIIGFIKIPNLPKCDGAIYVRGDSMYPLLKSGDIAIFKEVHSFENVVFGEMYIVDYHFNGDDYLVVKFVTKSEIDNHIQLVSYNTYHSPADIPINCIRAMAIVKASVRLNTMI